MLRGEPRTPLHAPSPKDFFGNSGKAFSCKELKLTVFIAPQKKGCLHPQPASDAVVPVRQCDCVDANMRNGSIHR